MFLAKKDDINKKASKLRYLSGIVAKRACLQDKQGNMTEAVEPNGSTSTDLWKCDMETD
jgi:hypothetical protein